MTILYVNTLIDVKNYPTPSDVIAVITHGYYEIGDGGGAFYKRSGSLPPHKAYVISATGGIFVLSPSCKINTRMFGAVCDKVTPDAVATQNAIDFCASYNPPVPLELYPSATLIESKLSIKVNGFILYGPSSIIVPSITNGDPVVSIENGVNDWRLSGFGISAPINYQNFESGASLAQNCIGISAVDFNGDYPTRFTIDDVYVFGCAVGVKLKGFIFRARVKIQRCELGLDLHTANASEISAQLEFNRKSYSVVNSDAVHFSHLLDEGSISGMRAATVDGCKGVKISSIYLEGGAPYQRTEPFLVVGGNAPVYAFSAEAGKIASSGAMAPGVPAILLDQVDGGIICAHIDDGAGKTGADATLRASNIDIKVSRSFGVPQDDSKIISRGYNYFANSNFDLWFRGWELVIPINTVISKETTTVRRGEHALKVQANAASTFAYCQFKLTGPQVVAMRGKAMRLAAWVFIPNISEYTTDAWTAFPGITLQSYNGSVVTTSNTVNNVSLRNAWNFIHSELTIQPDATEIYVNLFTNQSSNMTSGNEYLIFDNVSICESAVGIFRQSKGEYVDHPLIPIGVSDRMIFFSDVAPTDANQIYDLGDQVWKLTPIAGSSPGWICTTAGAGGTAVFKAMAALAA